VGGVCNKLPEIISKPFPLPRRGRFLFFPVSGGFSTVKTFRPVQDQKAESCGRVGGCKLRCGHPAEDREDSAGGDRESVDEADAGHRRAQEAGHGGGCEFPVDGKGEDRGEGHARDEESLVQCEDAADEEIAAEIRECLFQRTSRCAQGGVDEEPCPMPPVRGEVRRRRLPHARAESPGTLGRSSPGRSK
jgi:hypothetical protein